MHVIRFLSIFYEYFFFWVQSVLRIICVTNMSNLIWTSNCTFHCFRLLISANLEMKSGRRKASLIQQVSSSTNLTHLFQKEKKKTYFRLLSSKLLLFPEFCSDREWGELEYGSEADGLSRPSATQEKQGLGA